ncbi:hypothetical protein GLOIN_2v1030212 [Rhizophagus clarus]|nr:hypothetical protein GLOIN_2v1030212 [Rhizophagus clarus]
MDSFLLEAHKKIVSSEIKQRNKEKKLSKAEQASLNQDQESDTGCSTSENRASDPEGIIPEVSNPVTKISAGAPLSKNSHRKKGAENISQMISDGIRNDSQSQKCILGFSNDILLQQSQISSTVSLLTLAQLFDKATDAEYGAIHANQEEILCWYYYGKKFITQVNEVTKGNKIGEKKAKGIIYDKMLEDLSILHKKRSEETGLQLPEITRKYLQGKTQEAVKIYNLFEKVGVDKIKYITTYTANAISELTNDKLQEIIDNCSLCEHPKELHHTSPKDESSISEISAGAPLPKNNVTENSETSLPIPEENSSLSADLDDYINMLTGDIDDETLVEIATENEAKVEKEEVNEMNEWMPDDSDDDGYGGYNEYGERDRGYYYRDGGYERKTSPMMSPIISPVTA